jgi:origin recognition complex subunit 3
MHHYYANPLSVFSPFSGSSLSKETILTMYEDGHLTQDHATHIRMLPSFRTYIDTICESKPHEALRLLEDDAYLITDAVPRFLFDLDEYQKSFYAAFTIMTTVQACFPTFAGLRRSNRMLYLELLETKNGLVNSEFVRWLVSLVRKMTVDSLEALLRGLCELVDGEHNETSRFVFEKNNPELDSKKKVQGWMERLGMEEIQEDESVDETHTAMVVEEQLPDLDEGRQTKTAKRVKMYIITKKGGEPVKVSNEIADWLQAIFRYQQTRYQKVMTL